MRFPNVSGIHAQLTFQDGYWYIRDLNSTNGIKVNGMRVQEKMLHPGDEISICQRRVHDPVRAAGRPPRAGRGRGRPAEPVAAGEGRPGEAEEAEREGAEEERSTPPTSCWATKGLPASSHTNPTRRRGMTVIPRWRFGVSVDTDPTRQRGISVIPRWRVGLVWQNCPSRAFSQHCNRLHCAVSSLHRIPDRFHSSSEVPPCARGCRPCFPLLAVVLLAGSVQPEPDLHDTRLLSQPAVSEGARRLHLRRRSLGRRSSTARTSAG